MRKIHLFFILLLAPVSFLIWFGIGHGVAWLLDAGLSIDVNKSVFIKAGAIVGTINGSWILILGLLQNRLLKKREIKRR